MINTNRKVIIKVQILIDVFTLVISLLSAYYIRFFDSNGNHLDITYYLKTLVVLIPLQLIIYTFLGIYNEQKRKAFTNDLYKIISANILGITILLSILFVMKLMDYSRLVFVLFVLINCSLALLQRASIKVLITKKRKQGDSIKRLLIIGGGGLGRKITQRINEINTYEYEIIGILDDNISEGKSVSGIKILGSIDKLDSYLIEHHIDEIIIALPLKQYDKLKYIFGISEKNGIRTNIIPDYARYIPARPLVDEIAGIPLINTRYVPLDNVANNTLKRIFDILLSTIGIIFCSPILIIVAVVIKIESPGPLLFKQERVGLNRRAFMMYKFRSMRVQEEKSSDTNWTTQNDPRKTRVGALIRKTSIDELPQLFNVLKGDMSLIGPRPERPFFVEQFKEEIPKYMIKHQVRPGITGWAQVNGWRGDTSIRKRIDCDLYYIENWTFMLDIKIIFLTFFKGFVNKNAY
ncbi:MAG: undecaprenyl-phosphate glucose phosphotransferase [Gracilibacter sp. BRH_c7a]|nr:MAG: undecaprenyl-phosphate glucose phosphotransferase [Gracilibacter sp. BRH_c7a]